MQPPRFFCGVILFLVLAPVGLAEEPADWKWQDDGVPAVGFDLDRVPIIRVTSLAGKGPGSLAEALASRGPRVIVFEVGGVIDLELQSLSIRESQVIVAGQTAPEPGITLIRGGIEIEADQVVLQHLRVRPGDAGRAKKGKWEPDGITTTGGPSDVWIDHCSVTWSVDENVSATTYEPADGQPARRIHIRHCLIAEGLSQATHQKGEHSKGTLVFGGSQEVAIVGNLYACNTERNPLFQPDTSGVVVNNLIACPGHRAVSAGEPSDSVTGSRMARVSVVGNVVLFGAETKKSAAVFEGVADAYIAQNVGYDFSGRPIPEIRKPFQTRDRPPVWPLGLKPQPVSSVPWQVARFVGARPARRDATDARIVSQALMGTGRIIDSQDDVEGYPKPTLVERKLEVPAKARRAWLERYANEVTLTGTN